MADEIFKMGTLFIAKEVLQYEKWMVDLAISAAMSQLAKYKGQDGFLQPSIVRKGDFSLILGPARISPTVVTFIGVPGRARSPIIQELFVVR